MNISLVSIVCVIYAICSGATKANTDECTYVFVHKPVCGSDGRTYLNFGHLTCEILKKPGLRQLREGDCPEGGTIIEDGPLGDSDDDDSNKSKIKIIHGIKKVHKHKGIKNHKVKTKHITKSLIKSRGHTFTGGRRGRGRRSAEENYEYQEYGEDYPEDEYNYLEDLNEEPVSDK